VVLQEVAQATQAQQVVREGPGTASQIPPLVPAHRSRWASSLPRSLTYKYDTSRIWLCPSMAKRPEKVVRNGLRPEPLLIRKRQVPWEKLVELIQPPPAGSAMARDSVTRPEAQRGAKGWGSLRLAAQFTH
jgi:hypothetical protein